MLSKSVLRTVSDLLRIYYDSFYRIFAAIYQIVVVPIKII